MEKRAKLAFTGIPTCYRSPHLSSFDELSSDIAVLGIPFDEGVGYRPGTRFGPRSIREYSMRFPYFDPSSEEFGYWEMEQKKRLLSRVTMADCGDVDVVPLDYEYVYRQIEGSIKTILKKGAFPVALGGDHSITYPIVRGFEGTGSLSLVQLDAHLDRRESVLDVRFGHGSPIKRISELPFIEKIVSLGMRGPRAPEKDFLEAERRGEILIPAHLIEESGIENTLDRIPAMERCYVTIDIDVFDPSVADRVRALVAVAGTPRFVQGPDWPHAMPDATFRQFAAALAIDHAGALDRFLGLQVRGGVQARDAMRDLRSAIRAGPAPQVGALRAGLELLLGIDLRAELPALRPPSLWLFGERDTLVPVEVADAVEALVPDADVLVLHGAAHAPFLSSPGVFVDLLGRFLDDLGA